MQSSCFSLYTHECKSREEDSTYPVEKFSPPSETGESRLRNTFAFTVSASSVEPSEGMRWTR